MKRNALYFSAVFLMAGMTFATAQNTPPQQTLKAIIEGSVTRAGSGQPLKNAKVTLRRATAADQSPRAVTDTAPVDIQNRLNTLLTNFAGEAATVSTDSAGRFVITGVEPGDYRISAEREGFTRSEYGQRVPTGAGVTVKLAASQRFTADIHMMQASVISGRVMTPDGDPALNAPVQGYTYQYTNGQRTLAQVANAQTNDLGEYRLFGLQPGEYFVSVTRQELADQTPVGTLDMSQGRGARSGRGGGQGVQALVEALGDRGGTLAQALGGTSSPPVYYPGTLDPDGATSVTVAASVEVRGIDFNLRPSRTATVSGRVVAPFSLAPATPAAAGTRGGRGAQGGIQGNLPGNLAQQFQLAPPVQVNLTRVGRSRTGLEGLIGRGPGSASVNADGSFEIKGVAPGPHNLTATARNPNGEEYSAKTRVDVGSADIGNVAVSLRPPVEIRGRVVLDATAPQQFKMSSLRVSLVSADGGQPGLLNLAAIGGGGRGAGANAQGRGGGTVATETVAEDGTFTVKNIGALEYRVRVTGLPQGTYIQSGRLGSIDALNAPFSVDDAQAVLELRLGFASGRVTGTVSDPKGSAAPGAQVVLVPDEARRGRNDAYFTATSDQMGQFTLNNVPPGSYKLFAWEDIPAGAYQYPDFLRRHEDRGQSVTVNPNGTINANTKLIPAS